MRLWGALILLLLSPMFAQAAEKAGKLEVPLWSALPFVLFLGCIAVLPLLFEHWWHSNRNKAIVSLGFGIPVALYLFSIHDASKGESTRQLLHELAEYASFIILLLSLYTISGGILLIGDIPARPRMNTLFLAIGAVLSNFIGTTGASMVLIRPLLRINLSRQHKAHLPIFFIFIVSNTGGLLTPLGDPPLFLGYLQGVDFFWTLSLWRQWLFVNCTLLVIFYIWDTLSHRRESAKALQAEETLLHPLRIAGLGVNGPLLLGIIAVVVFNSESVGRGVGNALGWGDLTLHRPWGELLMLSLTLLSLIFTRKSVRRGNQFAWGPIVEVAVLFIGIFVSMVPALALLRQHGGRLNLNSPAEFFWLTGLLSAILDNAPTYLTFATLSAEGHDIGWLSTEKPHLMAAISCGAVFMGAITYIGNGPNFMVKAIASEHKYKMPSFAGYVAYSFAVLIPVFIATTFIFFW